MDVFREVREPITGKLLFRFDPERDLVEIVNRRIPVYIDLSQYRLTDQALDNKDECVKISTY